ncbi:PREDICTED: SLIT and NTRK-like protein 2 [Branchiostoma belcheri]|uniref:SLIT and NTRK-like protein 2 n=1 Tax=Branchiostoma belcheri TaxID=7741 RepID=A0A6P5A9U8_BRABE|nr:PREDICTED: SLIT and NTRK-like protein 2 [Branchiostoma belcheri]
MKMMLVFLLILLKEAGPTAACSSSCSSWCWCDNSGFTSVPQDLPTTITRLDLSHNAITTLSQSDFARYSNLTRLWLYHNQISVINSGAFYGLSSLTGLWLRYNQLTILRSDMFVGLDTLLELNLYDNNIHSIEAGTFNATPQLQQLYLDQNNITIFPESPSLANISNLRMNHNQMETLSSAAYDIMFSISYVNIDNNPWQCDCRMLPIKQKMTGFRDFEKQIRCAGPEHLEGKSLLLVVEPEDLNCEETGSTDSTSPASFSLSAFLSGFLGGVLGSFLILVIFLAIWCIKMRAKTRPAPVPDPSGVSSNPNGAATGPTSGRHHTGQGASPSRAAHSDDGESRPGTSGTVPPPRSLDDGESRPGTSGTVPPPRSLDKSSAVLRAPLPPIKTAGPRGDVRNVPEAAHGDAAANISVPLSRHFIYQQTCPSGLPKGLPGL